MAKRECGSCRFFEKSGIGESGHCGNERCRDIVGIALVRRHELACRVGWDQDYYEPLANPAAIIPGQDRPPLNATRARGYQGMKPDDLVVAVEQTRPVTSETTIQPTTSRSRQSHVSEAHRRALERKQLAQQNGAPLPPRRLDGVLPGPVPQTTVPNTSREWEQTTAEGVSLPRRPEASLPSGVQPAPFVATAPVDVHAETTALPVMEASTPPRQPPDREDYLTPAATPPDYMPAILPPGTPSIPSSSPSAPPQSLASSQSLASTAGESASSASNGAPTRYPLPEGVEPESLFAQWYLAERQRNRGKRCGNCRDFRPAEVGERGYCRNRFAFAAPQLVTPNDLACLSCLGTWWAANDQWWLHRANTSRHDEPTPQADRILDELRVREEQERPERHPYSG